MKSKTLNNQIVTHLFPFQKIKKIESYNQKYFQALFNKSLTASRNCL